MAQRDYSSSQDDYRQGASGGPRSAAGGNYGDTRPSEHSQPYGEQSGDYPPGGGMRHQEARNFGGGQQGGGYRDS
ncbi:MAG TPA: hypothetical protein VE029_05975, partial [Rhizobacter sp.]|nr:hypothetical protein [Rhizobacter sp.]